MLFSRPRVIGVALAASLTLSSCGTASPSDSYESDRVANQPAQATGGAGGATPVEAPVTTLPGAGGDLCARLTLQAQQNLPLFAPSSNFNRPAACYGVRADSTHWSSNWFRYANVPGRTDATARGEIRIAFDAYSSPIYYTEDATTTIRVFGAGWAYGVEVGNSRSIPWNPAWKPATGNDQEMIIADRVTGKEWGLWGVQLNNWSQCLTWDNVLAGFTPGVDLCVFTANIGRDLDGSISNAKTSSGFTSTGGRGLGRMLDRALLPTLDEIENGSINHAINMETYATLFGPGCTKAQLGTAAAGVDCGYAVSPATRLEWHSGPASTECGSVALQNTSAERAKTVPEGMRFVHTLSDTAIDTWLNQRGYTGKKRSTARIFAVALRDYGWIISDTTCFSSHASVEGVANPKARSRWIDLGISNPTTDSKTLLEGLITSETQVRAVNSPEPTLFTAAR